MTGLIITGSHPVLADRHHHKKAPAVDRRELGKVVVEEDDDRPKKKDDSDGPDAAAVLPIKLDDVIEAAVQRSPDLARAKTDRAVAAGEAGASRRNQQWSFSGNVDYTRNSVGDHVDVAPFSTVGTDKITAALGLGRRLPSGGEVSLQIGVDRTITEINIPAGLQDAYNGGLAAASTTTPPTGPAGDNDHIPSSQAHVGLKFKQPLLRGLGSDVALAEEHKADLGLAVATIKTQLAAEEMLRDLIKDYYELQYAAYEVDTRAEALALAQKQEQITREEMRAGTAPQTALNTVTYEIDTREEALLRAKTTLSQKSLEMRRKAGLEITRRNIVMRPAEAFEIGEEEWDVEATIQRAHRANRRLAQLGLQRKVSEIDMTVAKNAMLPQLDATLSGAIVGNGSGPGQALNSMSSVDGFEVMAGLSFQLDVGDAAKNGYQAAVARRHKIDVDREDLERQIDVEVYNAAEAVSIAKKRVALKEKSIVVADENAKAERASFLLTHSNNFQVMQRQTQLIDARLGRGRAIADYRIAVGVLQFLSGTLLEQYHIDVHTHGEER